MPALFGRQGLQVLVSCCAVICSLFVGEALAQHHRKDALGTPSDVSRMVFKENKKMPSCQLTLMHVYTSKFNKKFTQFAFTGSVVAKREKGKALVLTVVGQNHELSPSGKDFKPFVLPRIELGVEDASVRRLTEHTHKCKAGHVCAQYKDSKKHELQAWVSDDQRNLSLLFPLTQKQPAVVIDLSKFGPSGKETEPPLAQFKSCTASLR
jgi:hypothetical protein